jgi:hypothetical protein
MKKFCSLLLVLFVAHFGFAQTTISSESTTTLEGKVMDQDLGDVVIGANVKISKDTKVVKGAVTNLDGKFRVSLDAGTYDVEVSFTGMNSVKITGVQVLNKTANSMETILMGSSDMLDEVIIEKYRVPLIKKDVTSGGQTLTSDDLTPLPTRNTKVSTATSAVKARDSEENPYKGRAVTAPGTAVEMRSVREKPAKKFFAVDAGATEAKISSLESAKTLVVGAATSAPEARAGLLTAGEWNDLHNWQNHFSQIYADGETTEATALSGMYPENRYAVMLKTEAQIPLANVTVELRRKDGTVVWTAVTDNFGKAELWYDVFRKDEKSQKNKEKLEFFAKINGKSVDLGKAEPTKQGPDVKTIAAACNRTNAIDLMWVVDATASMSDEINYLKAELTDVIEGVQRNLPKADIRSGAVFYRDFGDDYVVKSAPFDSKLAPITDFIRAQRAGGGGDTPEAADSALVAAILHQSWRPEAAARICFLILDASPHRTEQTKLNLENAIRAAAQKGIRIVPIAASGIQKETEFLMKYLAILTNGTYVFLTDHSGIGDKHLEPTAETYTVELLNDLLVRIITEYSTQTDCDGQTELTIQPRDAQQPTLAWSVYPNPASNLTNLELPEGVEFVKVFNSEGKLVKTMLSPKAGLMQLPLQELAVGYYIVQIATAQGMGTARLVLVRD